MLYTEIYIEIQDSGISIPILSYVKEYLTHLSVSNHLENEVLTIFLHSVI